MGKIILRLDRMMVERKISLNELAERVGISNVNLSKIKITRSRLSAFPPLRQSVRCLIAKLEIFLSIRRIEKLEFDGVMLWNGLIFSVWRL